MRPLRLTLDGFTSFKDKQTVDFADLDLFVISGATGAGKSSLLDAVTYALYGKVPRVDEHGLRELISQGRDRMAVVLEFQVGEQSYLISRTRRRRENTATQVQLEKLNGTTSHPIADKVGTVADEIGRLLGLGFEAFTQAVILPQGRFADFLNSEPRDRRKRLIELLRLMVYERMRVRAARLQAEHAGKKASLERRLEEDFKDVTESALTGLRGRDEELRKLIEDLGLHLEELTRRRDEFRRDHEKTRELTTKQEQLEGLRLHDAEIEADVRRLQAAQRAAPVIPLLNQADRARRDSERRASDLALAQERFRDLSSRCEMALAGLKRANDAAAILPELRLRREMLSEVMGKLAHRDALEDAHAEHRARRDRIRDARQKHEIRRVELSGEIAGIRRQLDDAEAEVTGIAYDPEVHRRLEAARDPSTRLRAEGGRITAETRRAEQKEQEAADAEAKAAAATAASIEAARVGQEAERNRSRAEAALDEARNAHLAAHLRQGLGVGQPCPVCLREIAELPDAAPEPILERVQAEAEDAAGVAREAARAAGQRERDAASARTQADALRRTAAEAREALETLVAKVTALRLDLDGQVGALVAGAPGDPLEDRVIAASDAWALRARDHLRAEAEVVRIRQELAMKQKESESLDREFEASGGDLVEAEGRLGETEESLERLRREIRSVTDSEEPQSERGQIDARIKTLETELASASQAAAGAERDREGARGQIEPLRRFAEEAALAAERLTRETEGAIRDSFFPDADAIRAAALSVEETEVLRTRIDHHRGAVRTLESRIAELVNELNGRRVAGDELKQAEEDWRKCHEQHQTARDEQASTAHQVRQLEEKLERADALRRELDDHRRQHRVYLRLASDLQSDRFQAYLLEEALGELVRGASQQLGRLTTDRYGLDFQNDQIVVIDRDNAGERRATDTLSGGETFLASLSLALELSDQVQRARGAIHLDCLFIDEGFGTLDPETLRVVADSVRSLQVGGRMVGIITHIPELREEFDQRLVVVKEGGTSRVRLENL